MRIAAAALWLAAATAATAQAGDRQAAYNAAQAAFDRGDWPAAAAGFAPLLKKAPHSSRTDGTIRSRYAWALFQAGDREEEALTEMTRAVGEITAPDADRGDALLSLARMQKARLENNDALASFAAARPLLPADRIFGLDLDEITTAMIVDPARSIRGVDRMMADAPRFAALDKIVQAQIIAFKARAQLIAGDKAGALVTVRRAVALAGAMSTTINSAQVRVRGDAALIYLRNGQSDEAKRLLAYSGGGYIPDTGWLGSGDNELPVCGDDVKPDDVAVVEFALADDGHVVSAAPVYASRPGETGLIFGRAVRDWSFDSASLKKVNAFWRSNVRIEMRCVTRAPSEQLSKPFVDAMTAWTKERGAPDLYAEPSMRKDKAATAPPILAPVFALLADRQRRVRADPRWLDELEAALREMQAPPDVTVFVEVLPFIRSDAPARTRADRLLSIADRWQGRPDGGRLAAWPRVEAALLLERSRDFKGAAPLLDRVLATPEDVLPAADPIRLVATLHRSLVDRQAGRAAEADARLIKAGLGAEQCALFDVNPLPVNTSIGNSAFPMAALQWSMEGYVRESYDIGADGRVTNVRTVLAYPAFVFGDATQQAVSRFRYLPPTLNNVPLGCASQTARVRFSVPR